MVMQVKEEGISFGPGDITDSAPGFDATTGEPVVVFKMSGEKAEKFTELTRRNIGAWMDISVCGKVITSPVIQAAILGGSGQLSGSFTVEETNELAVTLRNGKCN